MLDGIGADDWGEEIFFNLIKFYILKKLFKLIIT